MSITKNKKAIHKLVAVCFDAKGVLDESRVKAVIDGLKKLNSVDCIIALATFHKGLRRVVAQATLTVESVIPLENSTKQKIKNIIESDKPVLQEQYETNLGLLGGLRVTMGDMVYDNSLRRKMSVLKEGSNG